MHKYLKPGDTFLDVGAHIGIFSVTAARRVGATGKVLSFELTPYTRQVLQEMVDLDGYSKRVVVRAEAISSKVGTARFFDMGDTISVMNSLVRHGEFKGEFEVDTISLDEFV